MIVGDLVMYADSSCDRTGVVLELRELPDWMKKLGGHGEKIPKLYRGAKIRWSDGSVTEMTHEKNILVISKREA